jgi:hypothetical protein
LQSFCAVCGLAPDAFAGEAHGAVSEAPNFQWVFASSCDYYFLCIHYFAFKE